MLAALVPATLHVTAVGPDCRAEVACEVTRNGPAVGLTVRATSSHATPPTWSAGASGENSSRAVSRKCITRLPVPSHAAVGRNSEKQFSAGSVTGTVPAASGAGQVPVLALVLPVRTCCRSGKVRLGSVPARFSPGEWYSTVLPAVTFAYV